MSEVDFNATRWSLVLEARGRDAAGQGALADLCAIYYQPVVSFLRREGRDEDAARELAHAFFETLISRGVGAPDPARGRFRNYLLGALKHFLVARRTAETAQKRGGHSEHIAWDDPDADTAAPAVQDSAFDRDWALAILAAAMTSLEAEHARNPASFRILRPWLDPSHDRPQKDAARDLGISEAALKVAIHRLRVRWREHVRAAVRATLHDDADLDDEMRHLLDILASGR
jgi:RNA polymerase sigma-70 factor (ECF subfamily)